MLLDYCETSSDAYGNARANSVSATLKVLFLSLNIYSSRILHQQGLDIIIASPTIALISLPHLLKYRKISKLFCFRSVFLCRIAAGLCMPNICNICRTLEKSKNRNIFNYFQNPLHVFTEMKDSAYWPLAFQE